MPHQRHQLIPIGLQLNSRVSFLHAAKVVRWAELLWQCRRPALQDVIRQQQNHPMLVDRALGHLFPGFSW